jgi:cytochrome c553
MRRRIARWIEGIAAGVVGLALLALLLAWSGVYSVSASGGHWPLTDWLLTFVMENSVETHAATIEVPNGLDDPDLIRLGAAHFHGGCAECHGAPGVARSVVTLGMLPPPPDLAAAVPKWSSAELFWIVRNGIKYAGMPAWPAQSREDEVWAVVAFLLQLPDLDENGYRELAGQPMGASPRDGDEIAHEGAQATSNACRGCHGIDQHGPASDLVPILHFQSADYLMKALVAYAEGLRESGFMQQVAAELTPEQMHSLATYYSALPRPTALQAEIDDAAVERGRPIAVAGVADREIPPCLSCHAPDARSSYPLLAGQNAAYLASQLRLWKRGANRRSGGAQIMAPIAERLSDVEIEDVAAFFSQAGATTAGAAPP